MKTARRGGQGSVAGWSRLGVLAGVLLAGVAGAADYRWLGAPASANWNEADENWTGAGSVWVSAPTNNAIFDASGTQSVAADAVTLSNLTFTADGYTVGGGPLLMYGGPTVSNGLTATITAAITNVGVWGLYTSGTVVLNPGAATNFFYAFKAATGAVVHVTGGTNLVTQSGSNPETAPAFWVNGGTLIVGGGLLKTTAGPYARVSDYGTLLVTNGICDLSSNGELLNAFNSPGITSVGGSGVLILDRMRIVKNQMGASYSVVNINTGGTIRLNEFWFETADVNRKATMNLNGGMIVARDASTTRNLLGTTDANWSNILINVQAGGAIFDNNGCSFYVNAKLRGTADDGGLTKLNSGTMLLRGVNTYNGATKLKGGSLNIVEDSNLGAVPSSPSDNLLFLANSTLQSSASHTLSANRTIWITNAVTATFDPQSYTQTICGVIQCAETNATFYKTGSGTVILDPGPAAVSTFGTLQEAAGTLVIASGTNLVTRYCNVQNGPGLRVNGGTLVVAGGVLKTTTGMYVNVDGGHLLVTNGVADTLSCSEILNGIASSCGYVTVGGSGMFLAKRVRISQNTTPATNNVVTVNAGGLLSLESFYIDINFSQRQLGMIVLNGGTVQARVDTPDFLGTTATLVGNNNDKWLTNITVCVREGGAVFDTAGHTISVKQPLCSDAVVDGGFAKLGEGTLSLMNTNTYNGATRVVAGILKLGASNTLWTAGTASVSSGAVLDVNGTVQALAGIGGSGWITNNASLSVAGTVSPGETNACGTLSLASPCALSGTLSVDVAAEGVCDSLYVEGGFDVSSLALSIANPDSLDKFYHYTVASCSGALTGSFTSASLPPRWLLKYDASRVQMVYNFGTLISVR